MKTEPTEALRLIEYSWYALPNATAIDRKDCIEAVNIAFREGQSNPKIKQLEWEHGLYNRLLSKTLVGDYTIAPMKDGYDMYLYSKNQYYWLKDYVNTIEEAKQFAQSDFENRVKECLITE